MPKLCPFHAKVYGCEERNLIPVHCHDCWYTNSNERLCEMAIAKALAASKAEVIVGGGDSIAAVQKTGFAGKFSHL